MGPSGARRPRSPTPPTRASSPSISTSTPSACTALAVASTSSETPRPRIELSPSAIAPTRRARCEMDLSPGTATSPRTDAAGSTTTAVTSDPAGDIATVLAREKRYASALSYTQEPRHSERGCVVGDRGRRTAMLCSRPEPWWMLSAGSRIFECRRDDHRIPLGLEELSGSARFPLACDQHGQRAAALRREVLQLEILDVDLLGAEGLRDPGEHSWPVGHMHAHPLELAHVGESLIEQTPPVHARLADPTSEPPRVARRQRLLELIHEAPVLA